VDDALNVLECGLTQIFSNLGSIIATLGILSGMTFGMIWRKSMEQFLR
jgi:ABC-type lipoprotein release transport system permease subunit